ncbi:MAG: cbb3-type cytochrome c oxidase subunit II [Chthoniobacterales bacterium]
MKGLQPLFLGIFGIFTFSWLGMTVVPNLQIGSLDPQTDEEGTDIYPMPPSGMALRGAEVYAANGCVYCHSQQVRPDYGGSDLERKWGTRRSAPRDYIFQPVVLLGKMRVGPDLADVGSRAALQEEGAVPAPSPDAAASPGAEPATGAPAAAASPAANEASPAPPGSSPIATAASANAAASPASGATPGAEVGASPAVAASPALAKTDASPAPAASASPATAASPAAVAGTSPATASSPIAAASASPSATGSPAAVAAASPAAAGSPAPAPGAPATLPQAGNQPAASVPTSAPTMVANVEGLTATGNPLPYTAAWHHRHLYNPRSVSEDSNMPAYRFLYEKRRISGVVSPDAINFAGDDGDAPETSWQIIPSYDAKCLVAYLMSLNQSHPLKEAKAPVTIAAPTPPAAEEAQK